MLDVAEVIQEFMDEDDEEKLTKEEYILQFIRAFDANERALEPFKEFRKDLRKNYIENGWLSKDELWAVVKAYRFMKRDIDFDQFTNIYNKLSMKIGA